MSLPSTEGELVELRRVRTRGLRRSFISSLLVRPLAFIIPIVTIPLFVRYLGTQEKFGLYETVAAAVMWLGTLNLGMGMGLINKLTDAEVANDRNAARVYVASLTIALGVLIVAATALFSILVLLVDWAAVFNVVDPVAREETRALVWLAGVLTLAGLLASLPSSIYAGHQELHRANYWDGAAKIATLVACLALVYLRPLSGFGAVGVLVAAAGAPLLVRLTNLVSLLWIEKPWLRPSVAYFDRKVLRSLLSQGLSIFALQLSVIGLFQTDKVIISTLIAPDAVTEYAILGRLFMTAYGVFSLVLAPLWPAYADANRRGDSQWLITQLRRTRILGVGFMLCCGLGLLLVGDLVLDLLAPGIDVNATPSLVLALTSMFAVRAWAESQSVALNAIGVFRPQILFLGVHAILNVAVAVAVARSWGVEGVAWSTSITGLVTSVWGYPWIVKRYLLGGGAYRGRTAI